MKNAGSDSEGFSHQDWKTYIVHCKVGTNKKIENNSIKTRSHFVNKENKMDSKINDGNLRHKKVSSDLREDFKKWRSSQNMTQKDVAIKLAVQSQVINKFESGQLNNDPKLVSKIKRLMYQKK